MNLHNEYDLQPGVYRHYKGGLYVVTDLITHMDNPANGHMDALADPLVVYRDIIPLVKHINGKNQMAHSRYARPLSEFRAMVTHNEKLVKRFEQQ